MGKKQKQKGYIYERDGRLCVYCGKSLKFSQISLDHYYPRSMGGTDDLFNMALSCRRCNKYKKSSVPEDWKKRAVIQFKKAVEDEKILAPGINIKRAELKVLVDQTDKLEKMGKVSVFLSKTHSFHVRNDIIIKIAKIKR
ncbi:MAG TPA: HNH endonuclease [Clostridia bacterium]|nr:HNH endonuclease [Clostridia bacterium]